MVAALLAAAPAVGATHHHGQAAHHATSRHKPDRHASTRPTSTRHASSKHASTKHESKRGKDTHRESERQAQPGGFNVTTVPGAGMKLRCGPGRSPLLVRKMTQGNGTTVTVICR